MKFKTFLAASLFGAVMFSCNSNDDGDRIETVAGKPTEITLKVNTGVATRADIIPGTDEENGVKVLEFYVFDNSGKLDAEVGEASNPGYLRVESSVLTRKLIVTSGQNKIFVAVVNMELGGLGTSGDYTLLKKRLSKHEFSTVTHNSRREVEGEFEMSGETKATIEPEVIDNPVNITVKRVVSKINAPIYKNGTNPTGVNLTQAQVDKLWGETAGIDPADVTFNPLGYAVVNGLSRSDAFFIANGTDDPNNMPWNNWNPDDKKYLVSEFDNKFYKNTYSGKGLAQDWFLNEANTNEHRVYVHENKPSKITVDSQTGYDPTNVYAIMLKGELKVGNDASLTKTRYWRVNLTRDDDYHIMRNYVYDVYIQNIKTIGHPNPQEAEEEDKIIPGKDDSAADIDIKVSPWGSKVYETEV